MMKIERSQAKEKRNAARRARLKLKKICTIYMTAQCDGSDGAPLLRNREESVRLQADGPMEIIDLAKKAVDVVAAQELLSVHAPMGRPLDSDTAIGFYGYVQLNDVKGHPNQAVTAFHFSGSVCRGGENYPENGKPYTGDLYVRYGIWRASELREGNVNFRFPVMEQEYDEDFDSATGEYVSDCAVPPYTHGY